MVFGMTWFECVSKPQQQPAEPKRPAGVNKYKSPAINSSLPTKSPALSALTSVTAVPGNGLSAAMAADTGYTSPLLTAQQPGAISTTGAAAAGAGAARSARPGIAAVASTASQGQGAGAPGAAAGGLAAASASTGGGGGVGLASMATPAHAPDFTLGN